MQSDRCGTRVIHQEKVERAKTGCLNDKDLEKLTMFFKAFVDQSRLKILIGLAEQEMCVCDIAAYLEISESAVSHQLRFLRTLGLVKNRREGTVLYYQLSDSHVKDALRTGMNHIREP